LYQRYQGAVLQEQVFAGFVYSLVQCAQYPIQVAIAPDQSLYPMQYMRLQKLMDHDPVSESGAAVCNVAMEIMASVRQPRRYFDANLSLDRRSRYRGVPQVHHITSQSPRLAHELNAIFAKKFMSLCFINPEAFELLVLFI
jgi:hypothetical protein